MVSCCDEFKKEWIVQPVWREQQCTMQGDSEADINICAKFMDSSIFELRVQSLGVQLLDSLAVRLSNFLPRSQ
eukprot:10254017-Lingulodinium_polyedra.AAC.1